MHAVACLPSHPFTYTHDKILEDCNDFNQSKVRNSTVNISVPYFHPVWLGEASRLSVCDLACLKSYSSSWLDSTISSYIPSAELERRSRHTNWYGSIQQDTTVPKNQGIMHMWDHSTSSVHCLLLLYPSCFELQQPSLHQSPLTNIYSCDQGHFSH